ncbi:MULTISPECIES: HAD-IIA family hydrolase [Cryobacterium]|uniref:HAD family hydrolase n=1 Tax=Cryobacterium algoritolerans TaxID=1259184 RepID=A0A4R8WUS9_9MICO|nr:MULTISPECIES: HAD-IIA family hydrolase [Cryobacterium]TFB98985.1 HAD family hydrolase [Cryobacterium sp. HLT2-28]TFC18004.1 HAD family hydrolase [Cryobacterium algoritolerans]
MTRRDEIECWLTDMDGVLVHENSPLPGAAELIQNWTDAGTPFLVLTNNSIFTPRDLSARLRASGLIVPEERIWTSALATADFLKSQAPGGTAFVIGEVGLTTALHEAGFIMTETNPDYVVVGETRNYSFEAITKAIRLLLAGARFIATNPDATGPSADGPMPATGAIAALISKATGMEPYVVGKPNPMMFRSAMNKIGAHSENTAMIGDRMDTDIVAGIEAGLHTILVMTGISDEAEVRRYPFRPDEIISGVHELVAREPLLSDEV